MANDPLQQLVEIIKKKKELQNISADFVKKEILNYCQKNPAKKAILEQKINLKSAQCQQIIKAVRANLRRVYGLFRTSEGIKFRNDFLKRLVKAKEAKRKKIIVQILQTHSSTKERLPFYEQLYHQMFKITSKPKTIIDLGCGLNPFSLPLMGLGDLTYHAYDLSREEVSLLNRFFKILKINGQAEVLDILHPVNLPKADLCFLFKMTDVLDQGKGHKTSEGIIKVVPAKFIVVSFPTLTMSGKRMNFPRRTWIELMCTRLGYSYNLLEFSNEIFYVIRKSDKSVGSAPTNVPKESFLFSPKQKN